MTTSAKQVALFAQASKALHNRKNNNDDDNDDDNKSTSKKGKPTAKTSNATDTEEVPTSVFDVPVAQGHVFVQCENGRGWQKRWCVLKDGEVGILASPPESTEEEMKNALVRVTVGQGVEVNILQFRTTSGADVRAIQLTFSIANKKQHELVFLLEKESDTEAWRSQIELMLDLVQDAPQPSTGKQKTGYTNLETKGKWTTQPNGEADSQIFTLDQISKLQTTLVSAQAFVEQEDSLLFAKISGELQSISVAEQRFAMSLTVDFLWSNHALFSAEVLRDPSPKTHLLRHVHKVIKAISAKGNDAWECDPYVEPFQKLYDPKQGDEWWKYVYNYQGEVYFDVFVFLRTTAIPVLRTELDLPVDRIPEVLNNFVKMFVSSCPTMQRVYTQTTNFSKTLHQLAEFSQNFSNMLELNRRVMAGDAKFEPDLFENISSQQPVAWPQLCYYPTRNLMELVWEKGWSGEAIEAVMQEQMELKDYPLDRQLLTLKPHWSWADVTATPPPNTHESKQHFFNYTIAPDLWSYSQWRYFPAAIVQRTDDDGNVSNTYCIRVERLLVSFIAPVILPQFFIVSLVMVAMFVDPSELADRSGLVLTLLLTAVAMYFVVKQGLPEVPYVTKLEKYVSFSIILLGLCTAETAVAAGVDEEVAGLLDKLTMLVLGLVWILPHFTLFFTEKFSLYRKSWEQVYRSQSADDAPTLTSTQNSPELVFRL